MAGTFTKCRECERLVIYGQVCACGNDTNGQHERARRVQELRRSNASRPHRNRARYTRHPKHRNREA